MATTDSTANEALAKVTAQLLASAPGAAEMNRRTSTRVPSFGPVTIGFDHVPGVHFSAYTRDMSVDGIGLLHVMPVPPGEVTLRIPRGADKTLVIRTQILWCKGCGEGWYVSGGRFLGLVDESSTETADG